MYATLAASKTRESPTQRIALPVPIVIRSCKDKDWGSRAWTCEVWGGHMRSLPPPPADILFPYMSEDCAETVAMSSFVAGTT
jgi:hypothetical protein